MAGRRFPLARAIGIWLTLMAVESAHGVLRRLLLEPELGDLRARQVSVFSGAALIVLVLWITLNRLGPQPARRWWALGLFWLGLTLTCARCHSHKYEPISQREYYQLFAFLNNGDETQTDVPTSDAEVARYAVNPCCVRPVGRQADLDHRIVELGPRREARADRRVLG